jgi:spore coat-associated protein N
MNPLGTVMSLTALSLRSKALASVALVGSVAAVAGLGTFGSFTSSTNAAQPLASGTVAIALGAVGTAANRLTIGASGLVPGDTVARAVQLTNAAGNQGLSSITLSTLASPSSLLDTDAVYGLQLMVQSCPTAWTEAGTAPAYTYTCTGTATTVMASRPVSISAGSPVTLAGLNSLAAGGADNLLFTETFPGAAQNNLQTQSSNVTFTFVGTQRAGTAK